VSIYGLSIRPVDKTLHAHASAILRKPRWRPLCLRRVAEAGVHPNDAHRQRRDVFSFGASVADGTDRPRRGPNWAFTWQPGLRERFDDAADAGSFALPRVISRATLFVGRTDCVSRGRGGGGKRGTVGEEVPTIRGCSGGHVAGSADWHPAGMPLPALETTHDLTAISRSERLEYRRIDRIGQKPN
jgi:hypothetical protein